MSPLDTVILIGYFLMLLGFGIFLAKKASRGTEDYFLGGRKLPWWALGTSGMSSNLDAAGTMTIITLLFLYGMQGFFIEFRGGVVLPIAVFLAFMGKWHQRSKVFTTAEWMKLRFGSDWQGHFARLMAAVTYILLSLSMVVFFLAAAGTFIAEFLPFDRTTCAILMAIVALTYTLVSGIYGVVWTDVVQAFIIGFAAVYVAVIASFQVGPELFASWDASELPRVLPVWQDARMGEFERFLPFLLIFALKGIIEGLGGSGGSAYMAQRFYAAGTDSDCQKLSMLWTFLFAFRWPMVLGFVILAITLGIGDENPEVILPQVIGSDFFPDGIRGLVIVAIFAASMSTFDSTVNAGASYVVKDVIKPLFPRVTPRGEMWGAYFASGGIVLVGLLISLSMVDSILGVWEFIILQLFPAFLIPFALRWFWGSFNGAGFGFGIVTGYLGALIFSLWGESWGLNQATLLIAIALSSLLGCYMGKILFAPTVKQVARDFFTQIRPFGWWPREWKEPYKNEHRTDKIRLVIASAWQILTFMIPMLLILRDFREAFVLCIVWILCFFWLLNDLRNTRGEVTESSDKVV